MLACPGDHTHGETAWISEVDREAADCFRQRSNWDAGGIGKASQVGFVGGLPRHPDEPRRRAASNQNAWGAGIGAAQLKLVVNAQHCRETEHVRELLGARQIWFAKFEPGQSAHLDHRVS
jgi:hypothetical protein